MFLYLYCIVLYALYAFEGDTILCDKVCHWLAAGRWFSSVSSINKTDRHDIAEILLKVALNTINQTTTINAFEVKLWFVLNNKNLDIKFSAQSALN